MNLRVGLAAQKSNRAPADAVYRPKYSTEASSSSSLPNILVVQVEQSVQCVCVCVRTICFKLNDLRSRHLAHCFTAALSRSTPKVEIIGQSSRSQEDNKCSATADMADGGEKQN